MSSILIYKKYMEVVATFGWAPYELVADSNGRLSCICLESGFSYWLFVFNLFYSVFMVLKNLLVTGISLMDPEAELVRHLLQLMYLVGSLMIATLAFNHLFYKKETANLITVLIQMETEFLGGSEKGESEDPPKGNPWAKLTILSIKSIRLIWFNCFIVASILNFIFPRLAYFSYSLAPENAVDHFCGTGSTYLDCWYLPFVQLAIIWPDIYLLPWAWVGMISFDIMMITITLQIGLITSSMDTGGSSGQKVKFLKQLNIVMKYMNGAYAHCIIGHSALSTACLLILLYGSLKNSASIFLSVYFMANSSVLIARAIFLVMLLATLDAKSKKLVKNLVLSLDSLSSAEMNVRKREVASVSSICVSSGGIYKIDYDCGFNFSEFLLNYIIFIIKL